jgi:toxin YoeB
MSGSPQHEAVFSSGFLDDLGYWTDTNRRVALRALDIVEAVLRDPFSGLGGPEPLKPFGPNAWSRRLTIPDRIAYRVTHDRVEFLQARYHFRKR